MEDSARHSGSPDFGALLRQHRLAANLSQEALAEKAEMSSDGISALERGYRRTPHRETMALLAAALGLGEEQRREFEAAAARSGLPRRAGGASGDGFADREALGLPLALTSFVGRAAELDEIAALVREHRLVTITGTGGIGKTQTALRAAAAFASAPDQSVVFVPLAPVGASLVAGAIAAAFGVREVPNRPLLDTLVAFLKSKSSLLVLDNCEHVINEAAAAAGAILARCPRMRILATSREPLKIAGERTYRLPSLAIPGAIALFADRAAAVEHRFAITDENAPIVAELVTRLDGIPLAIELAAARVNILSVKTLTQRLDERFRILTGGERVALPRQQTMRATIEWSYDLLSEPEHRLFERLSIFVGGWTIEAAEAVAPDDELAVLDVFDLLLSLAEKSLVVAELDESGQRYRFLESTRAFAAEMLEKRGEPPKLALRHAQWVATLADRAWAIAPAMPVEPWVREFEPELENARSAIDWALSAGEASLAARIARGFTGVWRMNHAPAEARRWLQALLPALEESVEPDLAGHAWHALATVSFSTQRVEAATRARTLGARDPLREVSTLYQIGTGFLEAGRFKEAESANDEALRLCREHGLTNSGKYATALDLRARIAAIDDRVDDAQQYYTEALALMTALGDEHEALLIRINMGELAHRAGDSQRALEFAAAAAAAAAGLGSRHRQTTALANLAAYRLSLGDVAGASAGAREALALSQWAPPLELTIVVQHLAAVAALSGGARTAARLRGYVDAWYRNEGYERELTEQRSYEILTASLGEQLRDAEIEALAAEGAGMSEEQAVAAALAV